MPCATRTAPDRSCLKTYEPDRRLVLTANPNWWGKAEQRHGNLTEAVYTVIQSDATRLAALASSEVDFVVDPPFQDVARIKRDPSLKSIETSDIGMQYLGFDQSRNELQFSDVKGRNPFKDLRVRRAVLSRDRRRHDHCEGSAWPGHADGTHRFAAGRRLCARTRKAAALRPDRGARAAKGSRLRRRLRSDAGLRQRHVSRGGVPGDRVRCSRRLGSA